MKFPRLGRTFQPATDLLLFLIHLCNTNSRLGALWNWSWAIWIMKNKKSLNEDVTFGSCFTALLSPFTKPFCRILDSKAFPKDWVNSVLFFTTHEANKTVCANCRCTCFISVTAKLFSAFLLNRFVDIRYLQTGCTLCGFLREESLLITSSYCVGL